MSGIPALNSIQQVFSEKAPELQDPGTSSGAYKRLQGRTARDAPADDVDHVAYARRNKPGGSLDAFPDRAKGYDEAD
jgi:hypothetical protein